MRVVDEQALGTWIDSTLIDSLLIWQCLWLLVVALVIEQSSLHFEDWTIDACWKSNIMHIRSRTQIEHLATVSIKNLLLLTIRTYQTRCQQ